MRTFESSSKQPLPAFGRYCLLDTPDARVRLAAMTTMASTLAHEVSQPLTAATNYIHACAHHLRGSGDASAELLAMIEHAARETVRAGEIIRRMRSFIVSGKVTGRRENLRMMVEKASSVLACSDGADVEIVKEVPLTDFVIVDRVQIEQVLANILKNACEAVDGCSIRRITISSAREEDRLVVRVEDSGPGLSDYALARVFEPLFTTKEDGIGLGMPICKTIVEAHGGTLWAESPPGGGAVFNLSLPAAD
jgi:C4-dicarboxylate-specific signal transduction histidine kinase